ncbi:MAG: hypothetical protein OXG35_11390 [Acidobacteria bacterium]|nr:hypothetical protein [Acidobacteriota bacterium]
MRKAQKSTRPPKPPTTTTATAKNEYIQRRRNKGLCIRCGAPAIRLMGGMDFAVRLAAGRGRAPEYHLMTKGKWQPGDPPPTLEYLTHESLCQGCKDRHSTRATTQSARRRKRVAKDRSAKARRHDIYTQRIRDGICARCGKRPRSTKVDTIECDVCRQKRFDKALRSPHADDIVRWLKAGESQSSIRRNRGMKRQIVECIALSLKGQLPPPKRVPPTPRKAPPKAPGTTRQEAPATPTPAPPAKSPSTADALPDPRLAAYRANIEQVARRYRTGQTHAEIGRVFAVSGSTISRWLKRAGVTRRTKKTRSKDSHANPAAATRRKDSEPGTDADRTPPPRQRR